MSEESRLSVSEAVSALMSAPKETNEINSNEVETDREEVNSDAETDTTNEISENDPDSSLIDDEDAPAEQTSEDDVEDDGETEDSEDAEEAQPEDDLGEPQFWDADDKEAFKALSPEAKALIMKNDEKSRKSVKSAIDAAGVEKNRASQATESLLLKASELTNVLDGAAETFASRWASVDWNTYYAMHPQQAAEDRAQFDREADNLKTIKGHLDQTEKLQELEYRKSQKDALAKLAESDKDAARLIDPDKGSQMMQSVAKYLHEGGITSDQLNNISAFEAVIATKAMLWDQGQANAAKRKSEVAPQQKQQPPKTGKVRPSATPAQPQTDLDYQKLNRRLSQTHSKDDAVALLMMQKQLAKKRK